MQKVIDIDWQMSDAHSLATSMLTDAFDNDPMMQLFDKDARTRLAAYVVNALREKSVNSMWAADSVTRDAVARSPYGAFGSNLCSKVGSLVMKSLYPETYEESW